MNPMLETRTAELAAHDAHDWSDALASFLAGTAWESAFDGHQPTAAELRAIIAEALGLCRVMPTLEDDPP